MGTNVARTSLIVTVTAVAVAATSALLLVVAGTGAAGLGAVLRLTARVSLVLFTLAFVARPARQLWPTPVTAWLLANRRGLGLAFAASHTLHLAAIIASGAAARLGLAELGGWIAYAFVFGMAITSNDRAVAWLGLRRWKRLHRSGMWVLWVVFAVTYVGAAFERPTYLPAAVVVLMGAAVRAAARVRRWRERPTRVLSPAPSRPRTPG